MLVRTLVNKYLFETLSQFFHNIHRSGIAGSNDILFEELEVFLAS